MEKKLANGSIKDVPGIIPQPPLPNVSLDDDVGKKRDKRDHVEQRAREHVEYEVYPGYPPTLDYGTRPSLKSFDSYSYGR